MQAKPRSGRRSEHLRPGHADATVGHVGVPGSAVGVEADAVVVVAEVRPNAALRASVVVDGEADELVA
jgi:hypothetical protein